MEEKLYKDRDWLYQKYWNEELSRQQIANLCGCSHRKIYYWMNKFSIESRSFSDSRKIVCKNKEKLYHNKDWLHKKYVEEKLSDIKIAKLCRCADSIISHFRRKFGIESRSRSEANRVGGITKSIEDIRKYLKKEGYTLLSEKYTNCYQRIKFICPNGHKGDIRWNDFQQGHRCAECQGLKKHTIEEIREEFKKEGYILLTKKYKHNKQKLDYICPNGHKSKMKYNQWITGERCLKCYHDIMCKERFLGENNPQWKGGVFKDNIALYSVYAHQIDFCEEVRRDPDNPELLQVRCTESSCRKWFTPTPRMVLSRISALNKATGAENRFYCSEECKQNCSIYGTYLYPKGFIPTKYSRKDQNEWAGLVKERDNYECQICGSSENLIAHHMEGLNVNPIESADIDIGITLCSQCDKKVHSKKGCRRIDLTKKYLCGGK